MKREPWKATWEKIPPTQIDRAMTYLFNDIDMGSERFRGSGSSAAVLVRLGYEEVRQWAIEGFRQQNADHAGDALRLTADPSLIAEIIEIAFRDEPITIGGGEMLRWPPSRVVVLVRLQILQRAGVPRH